MIRTPVALCPPTVSQTIEGAIPKELGNMAALRKLNVSWNKLDGEPISATFSLSINQGLGLTCLGYGRIVSRLKCSMASKQVASVLLRPFAILMRRDRDPLTFLRLIAFGPFRCH